MSSTMPSIATTRPLASRTPTPCSHTQRTRPSACWIRYSTWKRRPSATAAWIVVADALPIVGMRQLLVREPAVQQQILGRVAREPRAAFADELHRPIGVVAAAIDHAVEIREQRLEHPIGFGAVQRLVTDGRRRLNFARQGAARCRKDGGGLIDEGAPGTGRDLQRLTGHCLGATSQNLERAPSGGVHHRRARLRLRCSGAA